MKKTRILFSVLILFAVCFFIKNNVKAESITGKCVCTHNYYLSNGILKSSAQENKTDATTEAGCEYYKGVADLNWQKCSWQWLDTCAPATGRCVCKYYNYHSNGLVSSIDSGKIKTDSNSSGTSMEHTNKLWDRRICLIILQTRNGVPLIGLFNDELEITKIFFIYSYFRVAINHCDTN